MPAQQQGQDSPFPAGVTAPSPQQITIPHQAITWLVVVAVIVALAFALLIWLLCRCPCSKRRRQRSRQVLDDRNEFQAWNKNAHFRNDEYGVKVYPGGHSETSPVLTPLTRTAAKPSGYEAHPGEPVMVDEAMPEPVYVSARSSPTKKYGGWSGRFSRISQIGVAR